ncbi:MAG TPA: hypothetical protein VFG43_16605 [Geminicoccaceae bacterium]|nr:hypothetical protein [Geminicoccaceae bacterium]
MRLPWPLLLLLLGAGCLTGLALAAVLLDAVSPAELARSLAPDHPLRALVERAAVGAWSETDRLALLLLAVLPVLALADLRRQRRARRLAALNARPAPRSPGSPPP